MKRKFKNPTLARKHLSEAAFARSTSSYRKKQRLSHLGKKASKETRRKISESRIGKASSFWTKAAREKQRQNRLGKKHSLATRKKLSLANKGKIPWSKGKKRPKSFGLNISKALKGRVCHWLKGKTYEEVYGKKKALELKALCSKSMKGRKLSRATRDKLVVARSKKIIPFVDSRPEKAVAAFLASVGIRFKKHGLVKDSHHQFDLLIPVKKLAIEVDGCWWHGCKKCCPKISQAARAQRARDRWWEKKAKKVGWQVIRIWEHDIRTGKFETLLLEAIGLTKSSKEVPRGKSSSIR